MPIKEQYSAWVTIMSTLVGLYGVDWIYLQDDPEWTVIISIN